MKRLIRSRLLLWSTRLDCRRSSGSRLTRSSPTHQQAIVREFVELLSIPNVAADRENIKRNADLLRTMFARRGFTAEILETSGNPLVFAELRVPGAGTHAPLLRAL